jgi:hypothetical protein
VALQGTIDAFPLTDVLQLLSASAKSGRLLMDGDRGRSSLWIEQGSVVGSSAGSPSPVLAVFELLRYSEGSFAFDGTDDLGGAAPDESFDPTELEQCLGEAAQLLTEWARIETVVPSLRHRVQLVADPGAEVVSLDRDEWAVVVAAGDGPTVAELGRRRGLGEFDCSAAVAGMVARSLVEVLEPDTSDEVDPDLVGAADERADHVTTADPAEGERALDDVLDRLLDDDAAPSTQDEPFPQHFPIDDLVGEATNDAADPWERADPAEGGRAHDDVHRFAAAQTFDVLGVDDDDRVTSPFGSSDDTSIGHEDAERVEGTDATAAAWDEIVAEESAASDPSAEESADEVLRQMQRLSPKAAEAIAAALGAPPAAADDTGSSDDRPAERARGEGDGPITFLGSL